LIRKNFHFRRQKYTQTFAQINVFDAQRQNANAVGRCTSCKNRSATLYSPDMEKSKATLRDVPKAAGVHISTASRALNSDTRITPDVVERVRSVAGKLGYRVNAFASSLGTKRRTR
jgi:hypothetical protein